MAKKKDNSVLPVLGGVFCLFVVFLKCMGLLAHFSLQGLILPSLWLLFGLLLLTKKKTWLCAVAMLPLTLLTVQGALAPLPLESVQALLRALFVTTLPAAGFVLAWAALLMACFGKCGKLRRKLFFLPIVLLVPGCLLQYAAAALWAEFGVIVCVSLWSKPAGK